MNLKLTAMILAGMLVMSLSSNTVAQSSAGVLNDAETSTLIWMREEEKLARDTYITLYDRWGTRVFSNISRAEQTHMDTLLTMLKTYGIADPINDNTVGVFNDPVLAELYDDLVTSGSNSALDALYVGGFIEELDIKDLWIAIEESTHADVIAAYENLLAGSYKHLRAFVGQIEATGIEYEAQYLNQSEVDSILGESGMTGEMADGSWIVSDHNGEGMVIDVTIEGLFVLYWLTYDKQGESLWLLGVTDQASNADVHMSLYQYSGPVFGPGFNTDDLESELWGELNINFKDCAIADVNYQSVSGYGSGDLEIQRIYYAAGSLCQPE
jgi:hypothetical protein